MKPLSLSPTWWYALFLYYNNTIIIIIFFFYIHYNNNNNNNNFFYTYHNNNNFFYTYHNNNNNNNFFFRFRGRFWRIRFRFCTCAPRDKIQNDPSYVFSPKKNCVLLRFFCWCLWHLKTVVVLIDCYKSRTTVLTVFLSVFFIGVFLRIFWMVFLMVFWVFFCTRQNPERPFTIQNNPNKHSKNHNFIHFISLLLFLTFHYA